MPKERALRGKPAPKKDAPAAQPKSVDLYCDTYHSHWTEGCFKAWNKCPFNDCKGTLKTTPPVAPKAPRPPKDRSMPLLEETR